MYLIGDDFMAIRTVKLTWHGHSCFTLDNGKWILVFDPYKPEMIGYPPLKVKAHAMLASHQHEDHNYRPAVEFLPAREDEVIALLERNSRWPAVENDYRYYYKTVAVKHDDAGGKKRGSNTIHIVQTAGLTIAHLGDLGHDLDADMVAAIGSIDLLLIPVGGHFTIDAKQAVQAIKQIKPRDVVPMHYQIGFGSLPIATVDQFLQRISALYSVKDLGGPELLFDGTEKGNCYLLQYDQTVSAGLG